MKVENMTSTVGYNKIANQFIIRDGARTIFQSYNSVIVDIRFIEHSEAQRLGIERGIHTFLDEHYWNYSRTTSKYRNQFLGETTKETQAKIDSGEYKLVNLNYKTL